MLKWKQTFSLTLLVAVVSFFIPVFSKAADVEVKPGFYDQYVEYLNKMPAPTPLNGGPSTDLKEVIPSYRLPFSVLKVELAPGKSLSFAPGDKINLPGVLSYVWKGSDNIKKIQDLCMEKVKDEAQCKMPEAYRIPEFNNLGVYVQIFRKDATKEGQDKGDFLVDEFYSVTGETLLENDKKNFNINWAVPEELKGGNYYFLVYLNQDKSYDLLGTPLVVFSETKRFDFEVKNNASSGIELDKNNIKINGADYAYRRPAPTVKGSEVTVEVPLLNLNESEGQVTVKYDLYRWGRTNSKDLIDSKVESKILKANSGETLKYTFTPNTVDSVYDLKIKTSTDKSVSTAYARFVMDGKHRGIFRFLSFVTDGKEATPMFCLRDANWSGRFQGKVRLTLGDEKFEQEGSINADDGKCFILNNKLRVKNGECKSLKAEILDKGGNTVDSREVSINCGEKREVKVTGKITNATQTVQLNNNLIYVLILFMLLLIGGVVIIKTKNKK